MVPTQAVQPRTNLSNCMTLNDNNYYYDIISNTYKMIGIAL
jgi:hypothetical protein